jgi:hypothetical protein
MSRVFTIAIRTTNADFDEFGGDAVADILRHIAARVGGLDRQKIKAQSIFDTNGNRVGQWKWSESEEGGE